jgi:hypothetical protein
MGRQAGIGPNIYEETAYTVTKLLHHRVEHSDVRPPNVVWNPNGGKVMLIF